MTEVIITREHDEECITLCEVPKREKCRVGHSCWCSAQNAEDLGLYDPDQIGESAYNHVYDAIDEAMESAAQEDDTDLVDMALGELDNLIAWANQVRHFIITGEMLEEHSPAANLNRFASDNLEGR